MEEGKEVGDSRAEGSSAIRRQGQAAISLMLNVDGISFGSCWNQKHSTSLKVCNLKVCM